jgi:hypothetical protein
MTSPSLRPGPRPGLRISALLALALCALPSPASAQGQGTLTQTSAGFAWKRGALSQQLRDRSKAWTRAEARLMKQAFDRLPDLLLKEADRLKLRWRRDDVARGRLGLKRKKASATLVIEGTYVSVSDKLFASMNADRVYGTVIHELGHVAQYMLANRNPWLARAKVESIGTPGFTSISWTLAATNGLKSHNGFVSAYARSGGDREDFAESVEFYWLKPAELRRVSPRKFQFMRDRVFKGLVSPVASRVSTHRALQDVVPEIKSLGDTRDNPYSLVTIKGRYFMSPRDGGYNRVRYRGKRALRLAVSRTTIHSWVPNISTGSAPITVETQDGTSAPKAFEVTKPWWR